MRYLEHVEDRGHQVDERDDGADAQAFTHDAGKGDQQRDPQHLFIQEVAVLRFPVVPEPLAMVSDSDDEGRLRKVPLREKTGQPSDLPVHERNLSIVRRRPFERRPGQLRMDVVRIVGIVEVYPGEERSRPRGGDGAVEPVKGRIGHPVARAVHG